MLLYPDVNVTELEKLLAAHANAATHGYLSSSLERWNYLGSLYYVVTLITTIGKRLRFTAVR